jgi:polar amino acid transport system substrate-binding protein
MSPVRAALLPALLSATLLSATLLPATLLAQPLHLTTEASSPSAYMKKGRLEGYITDTLREALRRADISYDIAVLPWQRAFANARANPSTCVYPTARTAERAAQFKWVGPVTTTEWRLYGLARRHFAIATLEDARGLRIGAYNGDVRAEYLKQRGFAVDSVADDDLNPGKLVRGRIDLWVAGSVRAERKLDELGLADAVAPVLVFNRVDLYLACNLATPEAQLAKVGAALRALEADGTARRISRAYGVDQPRTR